MKLASGCNDIGLRFDAAVNFLGRSRGRRRCGWRVHRLFRRPCLGQEGRESHAVGSRTVGARASGRNGGMCNNGFAQDYSGMVNGLVPMANRLYQSFDAAVDTVEPIIGEEGIDCDFHRMGKLKLAAKPAHYDKLARCRKCWRAASTRTPTWFRGPASELGSDRYFGGMVFKKSAAMHMGKFVHGLATAAARKA